MRTIALLTDFGTRDPYVAAMKGVIASRCQACIVDLTHAAAFGAYRMLLTGFAWAVLAGIVFLIVRRAFVRPVALGATVSAESIVIGLFIVTLMVTFLLANRLSEETLAGRVSWWIHAIVIPLGVAPMRARGTER